MIGLLDLGKWCLPETEKVAVYVREKLTTMRCHDWDHTARVLRNAREIARLEHAESELPVLELAALLHDISRPEEYQSRRTLCHAQLGAERVPAILRECGVADQLIPAVQGCVRHHRFRSGEPPVTLAEMIIYDADKLDALGAVGIGRAFYFAGRLGNRLHNTEVEALNSEEYGPEDTAWREYLVKLRHIPERMMTPSGRALAVERLSFTHAFFAEMNWETLGIPLDSEFENETP